MAITLEDIKKLHPRERIEAIKAFEEEQKKLKEEEIRKKEEAEKKQILDAEDLLKRSIDEIASQEEEEFRKKEEEKNKKESLDDIADEAKIRKSKEEEQRDVVARQAYITELSQKPTQTIYGAIKDMRQNLFEKGYISQQEMESLQNVNDALNQKNNQGYKPNEDVRMMMSRTQEILDELMNPMKKVYR